jgi:hypothetical protein
MSLVNLCKFSKSYGKTNHEKVARLSGPGTRAGRPGYFSENLQLLYHTELKIGDNNAKM